MKSTGEWGEFFPSSISPFAYNETVAFEYFPLTKEEALSKGYKWKDEDEQSQYQGMSYSVPDRIEDVNNDICDAVLTCEQTGKPFKVLPVELEFYRKMKLSIPKKCPDQRHFDRLSECQPRTLWDRSCMKCGVDVQTIYSTNSSETIYCSNCYLDIVN